jgi:hypothetical protein
MRGLVARDCARARRSSIRRFRGNERAVRSRSDARLDHVSSTTWVPSSLRRYARCRPRRTSRYGLTEAGGVIA